MDAELTRFLHDTMPFSALIGAEGVAASPDEVRVRVTFDEKLCTSGGILHGGLLMTLADTSGAWCAFLNLPSDGSGTTTIESKTNSCAPYGAATWRPSRGPSTSAGP